MGREKKAKAGPGATAGSSAKDRHKRDRKGNVIDWTAPLPPGLNARLDKPKPSSKHKSWFEFVENKEKKKKLEFEFTEDRHPPPGFEFVPIGNPALTTACKELSREQGAMIFIVTSTYGRFSRTLSFHLNRVGHHIRQSIVEQARESLGDGQDVQVTETDLGVPEPIPDRQEDIDKQADAAIRDLFPRIPNTDRQVIIQHAFNKANLKQKNGDPPVGLAPDITLSRRVQLAVLAHIRHNHTRYDQLLRETSYVNARKAVEPLCLDFLVKWRGDEETGRDQLDEILCEVIVISDSESDDEDDDDDDSDSSDTSVSGGAPLAERPEPPVGLPAPATDASVLSGATNRRGESHPRALHAHAGRKAKVARKDRRAAIRKENRGFSRYQAARDRAWHEAIARQQQHDDRARMRAATVMSIDGPNENQQWRSPEPSYNPRAVIADSSELHRPQPAPYGGAWPIVGSRAASGQARFPPLDLKDHLVRSIEQPYSPETSQFPAQFHDRLQINSDYGESYARPRAAPAFQQTSARPYNETVPERSYNEAPVRVYNEAVPQGYQVREQPDFITLPPRYEATRAPAPIPHQAPVSVVVSSQSRHTQRGFTPIDLTGDTTPLSAYRNSPTVLQDRPVLRSAARPIWIDDENDNFRSTNHPVLAENRMPRAAATHAPYSAPDGRHLEIKRERNYSPIPAHMDGRIARQADNRDASSVHVRSYDGSHDADVVEIVRVTNKFPRQHNDPTPTSPQRYEHRSRNYDPPRALDGDKHGFPSAASPRRIERVVARIEEPVYHDSAFGRPAGYSGSFPVQRQERVVGIEYVPTSRSGETRTFADQPPVSRYEAERTIHADQPVSRYGGCPVYVAQPPVSRYEGEQPIYTGQPVVSRYQGERPIYAGQPPVSPYEGERVVYRQDVPASRTYENGYAPRSDHP
ncbi:hypothetical protein B0T14DRAFT_509080 [Immersiella caudata]|uniref:DUF2293 domain-containing protein n=1 Tax=Immersiella caudata TaxID=314043 RepID=A0AA39X2P7_9PEZI|nr:hypothetical protein B0T14DRAFT_509080 [Immersiella caudata]